MRITQAKSALLAFVFVFLLPLQAAVDGFVIKKIELEGARRITYATMANYLPVGVGDRLTAARSKQAIKALYGTGFFKDVKLNRRGNVLVVSVKERPGIAEIHIDGNKKIKDDDISKAFEDAGLIRGRIYNDQTLDTMQKELERIYYSYGRYGVKIDTKVTPLPRNRVKIEIDIREGLNAKIKNINIVGNKHFSDEEILSEFELGIPSWWQIFSSKDQYAKEKLSGDRETLRSFYLDRGYVKYKLESVQVTISPDKKDIYITFNITEGEQYKVRNVTVSGDTIVNENTLLKVVRAANKKGEFFSNKKITDSVEYINKTLGNIGYAFADTRFDAVPDDDEGVVDIDFFVIPNKRVYVKRIEFIDNEKTQDSVYRRELRQLEGAWYADAAIERSKVRLQRLPYVEEVEIEKNNVPGLDDQVQIDYKVKERLAGAFNVGVGYSDANGASFITSIEHNNVFGKGNAVELAFSRNEVFTSLNYSYDNPYYTDSGIGRGFNIFASEYDTSETLLTQYVVDNLGGTVNYRIPLSEFSAFRFGFGLAKTEIKEQLGTSTLEVRNFLDTYGSEYEQLKTNVGYIYDSRNRSIFASRGTRQLVSLEVEPNPSDLTYYKFSYSGDHYWPLFKGSVLHAKYTIGLGEGYSDLEELPFFEKYSAGGIRSVRGYESRSLGPRSTFIGVTGLTRSSNVLGGDLLTTGSLEFVLPPPGKASGSLRMLFFYDFGNVFATREDFDVNELRTSVGVALNWLAPLGAMTFSWADPVGKKPGDEIERFQFTVGGSF